VSALPNGFQELDRFVADWVQPDRNARYAMRLSKTMDELGAFYDAIAARAEDAMCHLDALDIDDLPDDAYNQPSVPDSGACYFEQVVQPIV
jgi:hypothetical protein